MKQAPKLVSLLPLTLLPGCASGPGRRSPSIDILGSYFPAWIVCVFSGLAITLITRLLLVGLELDNYVGPKAIVYISIWLCFTMLTWLIFYSN